MSTINISIKTTNTPSIIKFEANEFLTQYESFEFNNIDEAKSSPLAQQLFHLPFVKKVYISGDFVAIERYDIVEWSDVQDEVATQIQDYINNNGVVVEKNTPTSKKVPITVYAESTPNPAVTKFVTNKKLVASIYEFTSIEEAKSSSFATKLFHFPFVKNVFIDENYISITKYDIAEWNDITMELREFIKTFIEEGNPIVDTNTTKHQNKSKQNIQLENLDDTSKEIVNILNEYVKPAVASDGGNIEFQSYDETTKTVKVILQGACSGCPSSTFTLKNGIENMLKQMLNGKVETVEAING